MKHWKRQEAHDPELGARPLKRYLERHLVSRYRGGRLLVGMNHHESNRQTVQDPFLRVYIPSSRIFSGFWLLHLGTFCLFPSTQNFQP